MKHTQCPCNSKKPYTICCGKYHKGKISAPTTETLMRSRYSAYVLNLTQYIYRTWDENTRPTLKELREDNSQLFVQLEIINTTKGQLEDETGTVEFIASFKLDDGDEILQHHENSFFIKRKGRWVYVNELDKIKSN